MCASTISKPSIPYFPLQHVQNLRKQAHSENYRILLAPMLALISKDWFGNETSKSVFFSILLVYTTVSLAVRVLISSPDPTLSRREARAGGARDYKGSCLHTEVVSLVFCTRRTTRHASVPSYEYTCSTGGTLPRFQALSSASRRKIRRKARALELALFFIHVSNLNNNVCTRIGRCGLACD